MVAALKKLEWSEPEVSPEGASERHKGERTALLVVRVGGNLRDAFVLRRLGEVATRCLQARPAGVVLDLQSVHDADTRLVAELIAIARAAHRARVGWRIRPSENLRHWITLYRLDRMLAADANGDGDTAANGNGHDVR